MHVSTLKSLCETSGLSGWKEMYGSPHWIIIEGHRHVIATNGRALLLTRGVDSTVPYVDREYLGKVQPFLDMPVSGERISVGSIKEWAGPGVWQEIRDCRRCDGTGTADSVNCDDCGGKGKVYSMPGRLGTIRKVSVNRNSIAVILESVDPAEECRVQAIPTGRPWGPSVVLSGATWRAWMMGGIGGPAGPELFPAPAEVAS